MDEKQLGQLETSLIMLNEFYMSALAAGFTEQQAMQLVNTILAENLRSQYGER